MNWNLLLKKNNNDCRYRLSRYGKPEQVMFMLRRINGWLITCLLLYVPQILHAQQPHTAAGTHVFNIEEAGARGDGQTNNTVIIQQLIDRCSQGGGGMVYIPAGRFLTGTLYLKSNVNLHLETGAVLLGSTTASDYPQNAPARSSAERRSLLFAENASHIAVSGKGCIDGQGHSPTFYKGDNAAGRPRIIHFIDCTDVQVQDITLKNAAFWVQYYSGCDGVMIRGIKVYSHSNWNNDGLDIDSRNATISDCIIDSDDDALCFKSESHTACEHITVNNCVLASNCNAIKMGTASRVGFKNISISNCVVKIASEDNIRHWQTSLQHISAPRSVLAGIAIETVDGGQTDGISISNIAMTAVQTPVFIRLGDRARNTGAPGTAAVSSLRNVQISNITAEAASFISSSVTGIPGHYVENILLENIQVTCPGGSTGTHAGEQVPEQEKAYPENRMFGNVLPAAGIYARHVKNITVHNMRLVMQSPDLRPVFVGDDINGAELKGIQVRHAAYEQPLVQLLQSRDVLITGCNLSDKVKRFIEVAGNRSGNISLLGNNLHLAEQVLEKTPDVNKDAVLTENNSK